MSTPLLALGATAVEHGDDGAADEYGVGPQGQGPEHIHPGADAAVYENFNPSGHRSGDFGQDLGRGGGAPLNPASVVGYHDPGGPGLNGLFGPPGGHNTLYNHGHMGMVDDAPQIVYGFGPGVGVQGL
mgnify:CR=1 FL=1